MIDANILSIVIPISVASENKYLLDRAKRIASRLSGNMSAEVIVIDSSKKILYADAVEKVCSSFGLSYYYLEMNNTYSAAKARSYGAQKARGSNLLFYDVDLIVQDDFFERVLEDAKRLNQSAFVIYPCLYLSEFKTKEIENTNLNDNLFLDTKDRYLEGYNDEVLYLAVNTSTILVNKEHFFHVGGYDEKYMGHGYEDFDLIHRLYMAYPIVEREKDYPVDFKTNFPAKYQGFRKYYAYYALENFFGGMFTMHLYHPRPLSLSYYRKRKDNAKYFLKKLEESLSAPLDDQYFVKTLPKDFEYYIDRLLQKYGYNPDIYCGLKKLNDESVPMIHENRFKRKIRKLFLNPIQFFLDMINNLKKD